MTKLILAPANLLLFTALILASTAQAQIDRVISPEVHADNQVTFRVSAPDATQVSLGSSDLPQIPMRETLDLQKDDSGVWSITIGPVNPGAYRYNFVVDGASVLDRLNTNLSESNDNAWSMVVIPGSELMDMQDVPHGALAEVNYYSEVLGRFRRMHVYTPPGYGLTNQNYPVFYLLHGGGDSDDSWGTVGRAGIILDNLIASGDAQPMIVVMPKGHTGVNIGPGTRNTDFHREFAQDIKPFIESNYRVMQGKVNTALAGLSMGGSQTIDIAFNDLESYGYVGVFSSGIFGIIDDKSWVTEHEAVLNDPSSAEDLDLLWFSTGSDDFLIETSRATVDMFAEHGFDVQYSESEGGHTWINWRDYLGQFAPLLFQ